MGDLFCAATIYLVTPGSIARLETRLRTKRWAEVLIAAPLAMDPERLAVAGAFGESTPVTRPDIHDGPSLGRALESLADLHRGETVAVVAPAAAIEAALGVAEADDDAFAVTIDFDGRSVQRLVADEADEHRP